LEGFTKEISKKNIMKKILITGGAGFIGAHVVKHFVKKYTNDQIINLDCLTYAAEPKNLADVESCENYKFLKININDAENIDDVFKDHSITHVIHLAAESHVDRSIENSIDFALTNVIGTVNLLNSAKNNWSEDRDHLFYHISTDEVYGSLGLKGSFKESTKYDPKSPYSASKASSDHFVRSYFNTHNLPIVISNCSNNYGPFQNQEKFIPKVISSLKKKEPIPIYGQGKNIRDWLYVKDHVSAIEKIFNEGEVGETYNIGGGYEISNLQLVVKIIKVYSELYPCGYDYNQLISFVDDRKGHDFRYSIDSSKIQSTLGWSSKINFEDGIKKTIKWYVEEN
tara:strand:- start:1728 stop:2747 length:1020 start_codon:yes stop_codon:yes gene_type:complete